MMSSAQERHAQYYLNHVTADSEDWPWIDREWVQITRAWNNVCTSRQLVLDYVGAMSDFMKAQGLWRELIQWHEKGLESVRELGKREAEGLLLNNIGVCHQTLGKHL